MFTGLFPSEHGITNGFTDRNLTLAEDVPILPEVLSDRGYATAGFSNNPWVGKLSGLNRGFDRFVEWDLEISRSQHPREHRLMDTAYSRPHSVVGRAAGQPHALLKRRFFTSNLIDRAKEWLIDTEDRPSFTFLNLMEAHSPYYPPKRAFNQLGLATPGLVEPRTLNARLLAYVMGKTDLSPERRERVMEFYDASLRYQDEKLKELLTLLRSRGLFDDVMIVVAADHGKTLGEYDRDATLPHYVRDINVNVPLAIKWPRQRHGERTKTPVELASLFDAIRNGEKIQEGSAPGRGALVEDHIPHTGRESAEIVQWRVLADRSRKYVRSEDGEEFLLTREGGESVVDAGPEELSPYRARLGDRVDDLDASASMMGAAQESLSGATQGQLRDLGYLN
jgi:choline-sulfatase